MINGMYAGDVVKSEEPAWVREKEAAALRLDLEHEQKNKRMLEQQRLVRVESALDRLQWLAYATARSDMPHDHPSGVGVLDPVFIIIRQILGLDPYTDPKGY